MVRWSFPACFLFFISDIKIQKTEGTGKRKALFIRIQERFFRFPSGTFPYIPGRKAPHHHDQVRPVDFPGRGRVVSGNMRQREHATLKFHMVYDQPAKLGMQYFHAGKPLVYKNVGAAILNMHSHLAGDDTTQRIEAFSHIGRIRVQIESVGII